MTSPFLKVDPALWVASNDLAFALRDNYPVSEGHTLIIPKRLVATWFDATDAEHGALMSLVEIVKQQLDDELSPDGYNIGINAGEAAGQTVMHLHVHLIPRYRGDMDDPSGGVRHVIPSKGNYLRRAAPLTTGGEDDPLLAHIAPLFGRAEHIDIVAAFVQQSGLKCLREEIEAAIARGAHVRVLTGDYLNITQAAALEDLVDWIEVGETTKGAADDEITPTPAGSLRAKVIEVSTLEGRTRAFHPKSWRFEASELGIVFVGSSNFSYSALRTGIEWNVRVDRDRDRHAYERAVAAFDELWQRATALTTEWVSDYAARARSLPAQLPPGEEDAEELRAPPEPHSVQRRALEALRACREEGYRRALVVLATGLGKTWLAAFDVDAFAAEFGRLPRVLFLAHRREILLQASRTFRTLLRANHPDAKIGWIDEDHPNPSAHVVFASVQRLSRVQRLAQLARDRFDYIVVDEVHHATARTYRRVLEHFEPRFVLGLTATPDRTDAADVGGLFEDKIAYEANITVGIGIDRLVPFRYFGLKDDIDYKTVVRADRKLDPAKVADAVQTQHRMEKMWEAWLEHPGTRTLVFCASVEHVDFVKAWLCARGVIAQGVHSKPGSDDRAGALKALGDGSVQAVCSYDVFNEGVDVPEVDRVIMLRPTESPIVFMQQLGRGLRKPESGPKEHLTVIDFVGNHRIFLDRIRRLLSLAPTETASGLAALLEARGTLNLAKGCSIELEFEAKDILAQLIPSGATEVERVYSEIYDARGERATAGELQRLRCVPSTLLAKYDGWFRFVRAQGHLTPSEISAFDAAGDWFDDLEKSKITKCFKMVTLEALLEADALDKGLPLEELATRCHSILRRTPDLWKDVAKAVRFEELNDENRGAWLAYWQRNPIAAWAGGGYFDVEDGNFVPRLRIVPDSRAEFNEMTRELVDYRLARYRMRPNVNAPGESFECKLIRNQKDPIIKLPSRDQRPDLPQGETDVRLPDGTIWSFNFVKIACNVARRPGSSANALPDLLRSWYGPSVGMPGTAFHVRFEPSPDGWWIRKLGEVVPLPTHGRLRAYPTLQAAAGASSQNVEEVAAKEVEISLPVGTPGPDLFAIRASGTSMDGGRQPIREGDWLVMRVSRGAPIRDVENKVALVQVPDPDYGHRFQIKRIVSDASGGWLLKSDNPDGPNFAATAETIPIALLSQVIRPEELAPDVGTRIDDEELGDTFGLSEHPGNGRYGGHLFVFVEEPGVFTAPDRVKFTIDRRPGETAFVLARTEPDQPWRYCGVARQMAEGIEWSLLELDLPTWRGLGGKGVSRRLPPGYAEKATALAASALARFTPEEWVGSEAKRCRVVGSAQKGGLRIDGGPGGFGERTVSETDIAWALVARDDVAENGGILDEERVNRVRYLVGTAKGSTRWIDTGWALLLVRVVDAG